MPTIDARKDSFIKEGTTLRSKVVSTLDEARKFKVRFRNSLYRKELQSLEGRTGELFTEFVSYDDKISKLLVDMATAREVQVPDGRTEPISLNTRFLFAIYSTQLSAQRETVRVLFQDLSNMLNNHRAQANNLAATSIALVSLAVATIALFA